VQFLADEVLNQFRIVSQAVDGALQPVILRGQAGILLLQRLALLAQAINPVQTLVAE